MATPPPFVAVYEVSDWGSTTTPKTASVTVANGDILVVYGYSTDGVNTLSTPSGGGLTYTLQQSFVSGGWTAGYIWTAPSSSSQTFTLSMDRTAGSSRFGFAAQRFGANGGVGASAQNHVASSTPSLTFSTTGANSAVVFVNGDWNGLNGSSRAYLTANVAPTEETYQFFSGSYTVYGGYYSDTGSAGSKTVGLSAPSGQDYTILAVEILGTTGSPAASRPIYPMSQYNSFH